MKLSEIPDNVKRLLLATCDADWDMDELEALDTEELRFVRYYAVGAVRTIARIELMGRPGVSRYEPDYPNPWDDMTIELDEPLPAITRDPRLAGAGRPDCYGWEEVHHRNGWEDGYLSRDELLRTRYADVFIRELHFGWAVPAFKTWARTQKVPAKGTQTQ